MYEWACGCICMCMCICKYKSIHVNTHVDTCVYLYIYVIIYVIIYGHKNPMIYLQHLLLWFLLLWSLLSHDPIVCFTPSSSGRNIWSGSKEFTEKTAVIIIETTVYMYPSAVHQVRRFMVVPIHTVIIYPWSNQVPNKATRQAAHVFQNLGCDPSTHALANLRARHLYKPTTSWRVLWQLGISLTTQWHEQLEMNQNWTEHL
jgi:hypothetical protein